MTNKLNKSAGTQVFLIPSRKSTLSSNPVDITPLNGTGKFVWSKAANLDDFEKEWSMKPVTVKGMFDHMNELQIYKENRGEKGVEVITPFYTHLNEKGEECGILVNRGWVPLDLKDMKLHLNGVTTGTITGVLYRGDADTKYSVPNSPTIKHYTTVRPKELALLNKMNNREEASQFMLYMIDTNDDERQILPNVPNKEELTTFRNSPERH